MIVISILDISINVLNLQCIYHMNSLYSLIDLAQQSEHAE